MNILLSSYVPWWNAEAAYAAILAEELLAAGHRVWILTQPNTINGHELKKRGLPILTNVPAAGYNPLDWWRGLAALRELQERESIQIVDVFRSAELPVHALAARSRPGLRVVRTRGTARRVRGGWLNQKIYKDWCHALVASSDAVRQQMCRVLQLPAESIRIIYFPVDLPPMPNEAERLEGKKRFLEELDVAEDRFLLGMVARLSLVKGHDRLLAALAQVVRQFPKTLLAIVAKPQHEGEEGELPRLQALIRDKELSPFVRILGVRSDVRQLMGWMDVGVIPSISSEMNCRVAVEFFSAGTPVAAFPTGALPEVVEDGVSGLVAPSHEPADLATMLERLAADPGMRKRLGAGARASAEARFSRAGFMSETLSVFETALAAP